MKKLFLFLAIAAAMWQPAAAQTAPDLGILWQKEYPGINVNFAKFSKDGHFIYFASDKKIGILSVETGELLPGSDFDMDFYAEDFNITEDGKYLAITSGSSTTYVVNTQTKELVKEISEKTLSAVKIIYHSDISPDGNFLYLSILSEDNNYYILIYSLQEDKELTRVITNGHVSKIKTSHDGKYFVTGSEYTKQFDSKWYNKLVLWETGTWKEVVVLEDVEARSDGYFQIKFSNNDGYLGCIRIDPTFGNRFAEIFDLKMKSLLKDSQSERSCYQFEVLPDNNHLLFYYYSPNDGRILELHSINNKIKEYGIQSGIIESFDSNAIWKIFCYSNGYATILTNIETFVNETNPDNNIHMLFENGKIFLEISADVLFPLNITLYDITGNTVHYEELTNLIPNSTNELNINLPSGLYLSKVVSVNKEYNFKINITR